MSRLSLAWILFFILQKPSKLHAVQSLVFVLLLRLFSPPFQLLQTPSITMWKPVGKSRRAFTSLLQNMEVRSSHLTQILLCSIMFSLILISSILLSAVANVTTAVDIYSFGMCALEVRGALFCPELLVAYWPALSHNSMLDWFMR